MAFTGFCGGPSPASLAAVDSLEALRTAELLLPAARREDGVGIRLSTIAWKPFSLGGGEGGFRFCFRTDNSKLASIDISNSVLMECGVYLEAHLSTFAPQFPSHF